MDVVRRYQYQEAVVEICVDDDAENPRDAMDTLGTMWCWHRRYQLGSKKESREKSVDPSNYGGWEELREAIEKQEKPAVILPVYMYDHSGLALSTSSFDCPWDSGQVGFIFATREAVLEAYRVKRITQKIRERVESCLKAEVATYSAYANGEVYGFRVMKEGEEIDSCWGYYGSEEIPYMLEQALGVEGAKKAEEIRWQEF
jgi:hypothetical protein